MAKVGKASVRDVRRANRALVVRHLLAAGETSRSEIGEATSLSAGTVTNVLAQLREEGTIRETGFEDSAGGRPRSIVELHPGAAVVFGADLGESSIRVEMFDLTLHRLGARLHRFADRRIAPDEVERLIADDVEELLDESGVARDRVLGLGLGVPGIVENPSDDPARSVAHVPVLGWDEVAFKGIAERLGFPVFLDNGAKTTTQAEAWYGSAKGVEHAIVVLIGDGAGAGIITNGRLYRGSSSSAGEWGHTKISLHGPVCRCGAVGCVETFVGASAVLKRWHPGDDWDGRESEGVDALFAAYAVGDAEAVRAIDALVQYLGVALANLVNLYNPSRIIVGGWFGDLVAQQFLEDLTSAMRRSSLKQPGEEAVVERSRLGQDAVALGAATLPVDRFIETGLVPTPA